MVRVTLPATSGETDSDSQVPASGPQAHGWRLLTGRALVLETVSTLCCTSQLGISMSIADDILTQKVLSSMCSDNPRPSLKAWKCALVQSLQ